MIKHADPVLDPRAVNQDKKNILFSVSCLFSVSSCCRGSMACLALIDVYIIHSLLLSILFCMPSISMSANG